LCKDLKGVYLFNSLWEFEDGLYLQITYAVTSAYAFAANKVTTRAVASTRYVRVIRKT
jgi:hypothetical protein